MNVMPGGLAGDMLQGVEKTDNYRAFGIKDRPQGVSVQASSLGISMELNRETSQTPYGEKKVRDLQSETFATKAALESGYFEVCAKEASGKDIASLQKEGYRIGDMEPEDTLNTLEHIKATMAESGYVIEGFNDDLTSEELESVCGSKSMAGAIQKAFAENDIPVTKNNVEEAAEAIEVATSLNKPSEGQEQFLYLNRMEPTIQNLYLAEHSGSAREYVKSSGYFAQGNGYLAKCPEEEDISALRPQIEKVLEESHIEVNDASVSSAEKLVREGLPLTKETLLLQRQMAGIAYPISEDLAAKAAGAAMAEGKKALDGNLANPENIYQKAARIRESYLRMEEPSSISSRRMLEEIRLKMTVEANVSLLKRGMEIETEDLSKLVDALREEEAQAAKRLFPDLEEEEAVEAKANYEETLSISQRMLSYPLAITALVRGEETLTKTDEAARETARVFERAGQTYEAVGTSIRTDLGDSIKKAFRNVDSLLAEQGLEITDNNRRAVRALGYNNMDVTRENVERAREVDLSIRRVASLLTPASTLSLIRDGKNPLDMSLFELEEVLTGENRKDGPMADQYAAFLTSLEAKGDISKEEREAYIGIYRLFAQVEKSDGAVAGRLAESGEEITVRGLLRQVRSLKKTGKGLDYRIDDSFGGAEAAQKGKKIDAMINAAFDQQGNPSRQGRSYEDMLASEVFEKLRADSLPSSLLENAEDSNMNLNILEEYVTEASHVEKKEYADKILQESVENALSKIRDLADIEGEVLRSLEQSDLPKTADNLLAAAMLLKNSRGNIFSALKEEVSEEITKLRDAFTKEDATKEEMIEAGDALSAKLFAETQNKLDASDIDARSVRSIEQMTSQIQLFDAYRKSEHYIVPLETKEGDALMSLTLLHEEGAGLLEVSMETEKGQMQAKLSVSAGQVYGTISLPEGAGGESQSKMLRSIQEYMDRLHLPTDGEDKVSNGVLYGLAKAVVSCYANA